MNRLQFRRVLPLCAFALLPLSSLHASPSVDLSPNSLNFGSQIVSTTSGPSAVTVTNHLTTPLTVFSVTTSGDFAQTNNCGSTLAPGHTCTVKVTFTPTAVGTRAGQLILTDDATTSPQVTSLSGTGSVSGLASISVSPTNPSIPLGLKQQFAATGFFKNGTVSDLTTSVTWSSSNPTVAAVSNSAGSQGLTNSLAQGTTAIVASLGSVSRSTILTVGPPVLVSLAITPRNPSIPLGTKQQFNATGTFTDSNTQDLTTSVSWNSSNTAVAVVNSQGLASTAGQGMTTITASSGSVSGSITLTVMPPTLVSVALTPLQPSITLANTLQFSATGNFTDGSKQDLTTTATWSSSNPAVASISNSGGSQGLAKALAAGTTTISAAVGSLSDSTLLTVKPPVSIRVLPANGSIPLTTALQFRAIGTFNDGSQQDLTGSATWNSSDPTAATISNSAGSAGLATPVAEGTTTISASTGSLSDSTGLRVTALVSGQARFAYVTNLSDSTVSIYLVNGSSGQLTPNGAPQFVRQMSTLDAVVTDPSGKFLYVADRGTFNLFAYTIDATTGFLTPIGSPVFANTPFALAMHPSGKFLFMANGPGSVTTYSTDSTGAPTFVGQSVSATGGAISVAVDPSGKFVYTANVNGNTVSAYSVDPSTGSLTQIPGSPFPAGPNPFFVAVHPSGNFLYADNVNGESVSAYALDSNTGALTGIPGSPFTVGSGPRAMAIDPAGKYAFVTDTNSGNVSALAIESTTGTLQPIAGSPFPAGNAPLWAVVDPLGKFLYVVNLSSNNVSAFSIDPGSGFLTSVGSVPAGSAPVSMTLVK